MSKPMSILMLLASPTSVLTLTPIRTQVVSRLKKIKVNNCQLQKKEFHTPSSQKILKSNIEPSFVEPDTNTRAVV
jgi:hypothetical protein